MCHVRQNIWRQSTWRQNTWSYMTSEYMIIHDVRIHDLTWRQNTWSYMTSEHTWIRIQSWRTFFAEIWIFWRSWYDHVFWRHVRSGFDSWIRKKSIFVQKFTIFLSTKTAFLINSGQKDVTHFNQNFPHEKHRFLTASGLPTPLLLSHQACFFSIFIYYLNKYQVPKLRL